MSKSNRLNSKDLLAVERLIWECRELGDDAYIWRRHFFQQLGAMTGGELVMGGEMYGCRSKQLRDLGTVTYGFEHGFNPQGWQESLNRLMAQPDQHLHLQRFCQQYDSTQGSCFERAELIGDRDWYRSEEYNAVNRVVGIDQCVQCFVPLQGQKDDHSGIVLGRSPKRKPFNDREKQLILYAHQMIGKLIGGPLARFTEPSPSELPPRPRAVLQLIMQGESDKQIANKMQLSPFTINQYLKLIYSHFGVHSRPQLMARWIRRGWNSRAEWAVESTR